MPANNNKKLVRCGFCGNDFYVSGYRIKEGKTLCCSYKCSGSLKYKMGFINTSINSELLGQVKLDYENTLLKIYEIADKFKISRDCIIDNAKKHKWKRLKRPDSLRKIYRKAASEKMGRELRMFEAVHHIDLNNKNNKLENLHVYKNASEHQKGHASLEMCALEFFKMGKIIFNEKTGLYELKNKI